MATESLFGFKGRQKKTKRKFIHGLHTLCMTYNFVLFLLKILLKHKQPTGMQLQGTHSNVERCGSTHFGWINGFHRNSSKNFSHQMFSYTNRIFLRIAICVDNITTGNDNAYFEGKFVYNVEFCKPNTVDRHNDVTKKAPWQCENVNFFYSNYSRTDQSQYLFIICKVQC